MRTALALAVLVGLAPASSADSWKSQGEISFEGRSFFPLEDGIRDYNLSLSSRLKLSYKNKPFKLLVRGFGRVDAHDKDRNALFPEEAWLEVKKSRVRVRVGYQMHNWTATEVFHPADVLNSRYLDGDIQYPEKIGELMASLRIKFGDGNIEFHAMPRFEEPIFPSPNSRFRFAPPGVALGEPVILHRYTDNVNTRRWEPQWAVRAQYTFEKADISAHALSQIDRQLPLLTFNPQTMQPRLAYLPVLQFGGTATVVAGDFLLKGEGAYRRYHTTQDTELGPIPNRDHGIAAVGIEYLKPHESGKESTILLEGQSLIGIDADELPFFLFSHHALAGWRLAWNDEASTTLLTTVIVDVTEPDHIIGGAEWERRLGEEWKLKVGARIMYLPPDDPDNPQGVDYLHKVNQVYSKLTRYF